MCNACEQPSTIWGVDLAGASVAREVERLLVRSLAHRPPGMEDIAGYITVLADIPEAVPDDIGFGLAIYVGADAKALVATMNLMPPRSHQLAVAVFLGPRENAPSSAGRLLAIDHESAASVIAAMVESALLGPSGRDWPLGASASSASHVISGFVALGTMQEVLATGRSTGWGVGRARGQRAAELATMQALWGTPAASRAEGSSQEGMILARIGAGAQPGAVRLAIAECLPRFMEWRVPVFRADGLEDDEVEIVLLGDGAAVPEAVRRPWSPQAQAEG